jgi:hypothetical protein
VYAITVVIIMVYDRRQRPDIRVWKGSKQLLIVVFRHGHRVHALSKARDAAVKPALFIFDLHERPNGVPRASPRSRFTLLRQRLWQ